jgi:hypothetical protein
LEYQVSRTIGVEWRLSKKLKGTVHRLRPEERLVNKPGIRKPGYGSKNSFFEERLIPGG